MSFILAWESITVTSFASTIGRKRAVRGWEGSRGEHRRYRDTTVQFTWKTVLLYIMLGMEIFLVSFFLCSLYFLEAVRCDAVCFCVSPNCKLPSGDRLSEVDVFVYFALEWLHNGYDFSLLLLLLFCLHFFFSICY